VVDTPAWRATSYMVVMQLDPPTKQQGAIRRKRLRKRLRLIA
jgi:hypothetical protein